MEETALESPQKPLLNRLIDAVNFSDNINYRDPLGWDTLRDRWVNKTIGKDWREEQMSDIWDLLPDEWKPAVKEGAIKFGQAFAEGWQDRRTIEGKEFLNPLAYTDFAVTRGLETIGIPFEWMAQGISKASGLDIELSRIATDFVPVAGIAGAVGKKINKARLAKVANRLSNITPDELVRLQSFADKAENISKPGDRFNNFNAMFPDEVSGSVKAGLLHQIDPGNSIGQGKIRQPPPGMTPQQERGWFAKLPRPRIFEIGEELGGTKDQLRRIAKEQAAEFKGMENTISELNHMWRVWGEGRSLGFENSQIVVKRLKDGREKLVIKDWKGPGKDWETFSAFNKDHIRAVINPNLPGGGLYGANMADNLEAIFAAANRRKSNIFQLDERVLKNIGVPKNVETYIFRKLHPEYAKLERTIPTFWRESYVKNIINDYYEQIRKLPKKRWDAKMNQLVRKYTHLYRDKAFIEGLEGLQKELDKLMQSNIAKGISGKEIPEWMEKLTMPPGGFNSKDPWWLDLPLDAKRRWRRLVDQKRIGLKYDPEYRPSKGRYRIQPDD